MNKTCPQCGKDVSKESVITVRRSWREKFRTERKVVICPDCGKKIPVIHEEENK